MEGDAEHEAFGGQYNWAVTIKRIQETRRENIFSSRTEEKQ
jgi:hypothetical protein